MKTESVQSHADLAMQAARRVARARRSSQKAKMGHVVCHHLLLMLNDAATVGTPRRDARGAVLQGRRATPIEDKQFSLGF